MTLQERSIGLLFTLLLLSTSVLYSAYTEGNSVNDGGPDPEDKEPPYFTVLSPDLSLFHQNPRQLVQIKITDTGSEVNGTSVEFRMTTRGFSKWSEWKIYGEGKNGTKLTIEIDLTFRRGTHNYLQVRAKDLAGNAAESPIYNIKINTIPVLVITSPVEGWDYREDQDIIFDASDSYDLDDDGLPSITWVASDGRTQTPIGENTALVMNNLKPDVWTITVTAKDKVGNEVMKTLTINVLPVPPPPPKEDSDNDGIPNWFENRYGLKVYENDADEDPDRDGFTNLQEYQNLTNPKDWVPPKVEDNKKKNNNHEIPFLLLFLIIFFSFVLIVLSIIAVRIKFKKKGKKNHKTFESD